MFQNLSVVQESNESYSESPKSVYQNSSQRNLGHSAFQFENEGEKSFRSNDKRQLKKQLNGEPQGLNCVSNRSKRKVRKHGDNKLLLKTHNSASMKKSKNSLLALGKNKENSDECKVKDLKFKISIKEEMKSKLKNRSRKCSVPKIIYNNAKDERSEPGQNFKDSEYLIKIKHFTELNRITENSLRALKLKQKEIFSDLSIKTFPNTEKKTRTRRSASSLIKPTNEKKSTSYTVNF